MKSQILPVCIVGAGPTGLVAANLLGMMGIPVVLLERNPTISAYPRANIIDDESMRLCQYLGLDEQTAACLRMGLRVEYFSAQAHQYSPTLQPFAEIRPPLGRSGFEQLNAMVQPDVEKVWLGGLSRHSTTQIHFQAAFEGYEQQADGLLVTWRDAGGALQSVHCSYLLGCDGGRSAVREKAGIPMIGSSFEQPWIVIDTRNEHRNRNFIRFYCDPPRPSVDLPGPGNCSRYEFMLLPGEKPEEMLSDEMLAKLVRYDRELRPEDIVRRAVYTFRVMTAERFRKGRVFLLGDAAHMMPPFGGQGMNSCLRDAFNLCWKLAGVLQGQLAEKVLDTYEPERRPHVEKMTRFSITLGYIVMATNWRWKLGRNLMFGLVNGVPKLRKDFIDFKLKPPPQHVRGLYVGMGGKSGNVLTGWLLPQGMVGFPGGEERRIDAALGHGFALLVGEGGAATPEPRLEHPLWKRLTPTVVRVRSTPAESSPANGSQVIADTRGELGLAPGQAALVRPDRFVAGVFPVAEADRFAEQFARSC